MSTLLQLEFKRAAIGDIEALSDGELDELDFGVIGFDAAGVVRRYNKTESQDAGLTQQRVLGMALFTVVAPCMNNYMVAQRFADAIAGGSRLDDLIDYVFTFKMRPSKVKLRLLAAPERRLSYVLVQRLT